MLWDSLIASHPHMYALSPRHRHRPGNAPFASHPATPTPSPAPRYGADEINKKLFDKFNGPVGGGPGFSQLCSGNADHCHFTARKFSGNAKYQILENLHLILNDNRTGVVYAGDPWDHFNEKLRVTNDSRYYLVDAGYLREIPDVLTLRSMHLNDSRAKVLTDEDRMTHPFGARIPSRKDYQLLKAPKRNYIYLVLGGKRRGIPSMETLAAMGMGLHNVTITSEWDIEQIPLGDPMPDIQRKISSQLLR